MRHCFFFCLFVCFFCFVLFLFFVFCFAILALSGAMGHGMLRHLYFGPMEQLMEKGRGIAQHARIVTTCPHSLERTVFGFGIIPLCAFSKVLFLTAWVVTFQLSSVPRGSFGQNIRHSATVFRGPLLH